MLPRPDAPATRLAYTTADMSERLAKRKAQEQFKTNALKTLSNYKPKEDKPWYEDVAGAIGGAIKTVYDNMPMSNPVSTPINMGGNAGVSMGGQGTVKSLVTEPARLAVRRAVGDITAIPRVGEPSPSYTADQIREQGVVPGVLGAAIDYSQFIPVVAKGAGFTGDAVNAYKLAMMERQANPFPALRGASNVIDVVPGSRLPARIVDAPTPPATRLAQAQRALPPSVQRGLPAANVPKPGMVLPDSLAGIRDLPTLPSQLNFADFQSMPEYQQYLQAGQGLPTAKELADFGFDPERAYMVHSGAGDLTGGVLDPNFTGRANPEVAALNNTQLQNVIAKTTRANAYVDELSKGLEEFNRTGIWNGAKIGSNISNRIKDYFTRLDFVDELALNENLTVAQLGQANTQRFIDRLNRIINSEKSYLDTFQQPADLAQQGNFLSMYPASVGTHNGYLFGEQPTTYLVGPNTNQITKGLGPGVFEPTAQVNVPEYQVFGQQSPLASINYQPQFRPSLDQMAAARAFFLRKVIEDRMARGLYGQ